MYAFLHGAGKGAFLNGISRSAFFNVALAQVPSYRTYTNNIYSPQKSPPDTEAVKLLHNTLSDRLLTPSPPKAISYLKKKIYELNWRIYWLHLCYRDHTKNRANITLSFLIVILGVIISTCYTS